MAHCKCCGTHAFDLHVRNDDSRQSGASGGLMQWFSQTHLRCGGCFDGRCGVKATHFRCFWSLKTGKTRPLVQKCRSLVALGRWSPNTGHFEWQTLFFSQFFPSVSHPSSPSHPSQHCPTPSHPYLSKVLRRLFCVFA